MKELVPEAGKAAQEDALPVGEALLLAGKLVAPHASRLAGKLASAATFRRRVRRRVRRTTRIDFPGRPYLHWLGALNEQQLSQPAEAVAEELAKLLDARLAERRDWRSRSDHAELAETLVVATFVALARESGEPRARELQEHWDRERHIATTRQLQSLAEAWGGARLEKERLVESLRARSARRRRQRLLATGLDPSAIERLLTQIEPPDISPALGTVTLLLGPLGSGKSEAAEAWHQQAIDRFEEADHAAVPVWMPARACGDNLDAAVASAAGGADVLLQRGCAIVLDDLDGVDSSRAASLLEQAGVLVAGSPSSAVLVTSRPNVLLNPRDCTEAALPEIPFEKASQLIQQIAELPQPPGWNWPESLREAVQLPLFTLAAASLLAGGRPPGGRAGLVRGVVEKAMTRATEIGTATSTELMTSLVDLAVRLVDAGGAADTEASFASRARLVSTRLVVDTGEGLAFTLPIFEQWFAAQAVLEKPRDMVVRLGTASAFDRWRWSLGIAAATGSEKQVDELLTHLVCWNVGAATWVIDNASSGGFGWHENSPVLEASSANARLNAIVHSWADGLGPLARRVLPLLPDGSPRVMGTRVSQRRLTRAWWFGDQTPAEQERIPDSVHPLSRVDGEWYPISDGTVLPEAMWPWVLLRDDLNRSLPIVLRSKRPFDDGAVAWNQELMYEACRVLAGTAGRGIHEPIDKADLLTRTDSLLAAVEDPADTDFVFSRDRELPGVLLIMLSEWLRRLPGAMVERPLPTPDTLGSGRGWIDGLYSDQRLLELVAEAYGAAALVYEELADGPFSKFDWTLGNRSVGPIAVIGALHYRDPTAPAWISYQVVPLEYAKSVASPAYVAAASSRAYFRLPNEDEDDDEWSTFARRGGELKDWMAKAGITSPWRTISAHSTMLSVFGDRPASDVAVNWLWSDLRRVGLASGSAPDLSRP